MLQYETFGILFLLSISVPKKSVSYGCSFVANISWKIFLKKCF